MSLSHLDPSGAARMVDVSGKPDTRRVAVAAGTYVTSAAVLAAIAEGTTPKGDVLATARVAAIMGAKKTAELVPMCHPLSIAAVTVEFELTENAIAIAASVTTTGPTGVEMEALTAVTVAGLTLHDMVKALEPRGELTRVRLLSKTGGKSGDWTR